MSRQFDIGPAPHIAPQNTVRRVMVQVMVALLPGTLAQTWFYGPMVVAQIMLAVAFALLFEAVCLRLRRQPQRRFLLDGSAVVTAWLYALCLPPDMPWWSSALGMLFAIVIAKQLYGGIGYNLFNPAMVGYAIVLIAAPISATQWPPLLPDYNAISGATPLDAMRAGASPATLSIAPWLIIASAHAVGGAYLLLARVIGWQVPLSLLGTVAAAYAIGQFFGWPGPLFALATGGVVFAAFFVATDPVSGAATTRGRLVFGCGVALIAVVIRQFGAFPEGIAFAVLLMNTTVPWLDRTLQPRAYGR